MTGRELILYILENHLEDEPVYKNGRFVGFMTAEEAASRVNVGTATMFVWFAQGMIDGIMIGRTLYIPANFKPPKEVSE